MIMEAAFHLMAMQGASFFPEDTIKYEDVYHANREASDKLVLCFQSQVTGFNSDKRYFSSERARIRILCARQERELRESLESSSAAEKLSPGQSEYFILYLMDRWRAGFTRKQ